MCNSRSNSSSNGGTTYIVGELMAKDNLKLAFVMQTFENLILQNYSTEFLDIADKKVLVYV